MYQASLLHRRSSSPGSKVWSHNTGYTGAAGKHSEVGSGASVRNALTERRSSNALTTEEEIMRKEMKKLQTSRKHMEKSMLMYSQKMRDISERKSNNFRKSPIPFNSNHQPNTNKVQSNKSKIGPIPSSTSLHSISIHNSKETSQRDDFSVSSDNSRKPESRLSIDSGISLDSHRDSSRSSHDPYYSDSDNVEKAHPVLNYTHDFPSNGSSESQSLSEKRGRARQRKRFRDSKTFKLMPLVDKEIKENEELESNYELEEDEIETPRIAPFPGELLQNSLDIDSLVLASIMECEDLDQNGNRVGDSIVGGKNNRRGLRPTKTKSKTPYVIFRPKVSQSPSLAALRHRLFRRFGPRSIYFRYSEEVLDALRSLSNSPQRQKSGKSFQSLSPPPKSSHSLSPSKESPVSSPTLHGIDLEEVLKAHSLRAGGLFKLLLEGEEEDEFFLTRDMPRFPKLSREKSFSAPSSKSSRHSFVSRLEQVEENDDSKLKSVLKKDNGQLNNGNNNTPNEKKNVQFFLPDIFMKANVCTSQPAEFR